MSASDVSPPFHQLSHLPLTLAAGRCLVVFVFWLWVWCFCLVVFFFASVRGFFTIPPRVVDLDDRQGFTARSAMRSKKKGVGVHFTSGGSVYFHVNG